MSYEWDFAAAEEAYQRAIELDPVHSSARQWLSALLLYRGYAPLALESAREARLRDPHSVHLLSNLARLQQLTGDLDEAVGLYREALQLKQTFVTARVGLVLTYLDMGDHRSSLETLSPLLGSRAPLVTAIHGYVLGRIGRSADSRNLCNDLESLYRSQTSSGTYVPPDYLAIAHIGLGQLEQALHWLELACDARSQVMITLGVEPMADPLRGHPRFDAILKRVRLTA
jgi:serine/threonine-protein kinase